MLEAGFSKEKGDEEDENGKWRKGEKKREKRQKTKLTLDVGLIRTDAPEGTRFLVLRIRPLCHHALCLDHHGLLPISSGKEVPARIGPRDFLQQDT